MIAGVIAGGRPLAVAPVAAGYPDWLSVTPTINNSSFKSSMAVLMPAAVVSGDLLIMHVCLTSGITPTTPSGWAKLGSYTQASYYVGSGIYYKVASGAEGGTLVPITFSGNSASVAQVHRVGAGTFNLVTPCVSATPSVGVTQSNPDSPSLSPSWGSKSALWVSCFSGNKPSSVNVTSSPYLAGVTVTESSSTGDFWPRIMSCNGKVTAPSQDPAAWIVTSVTDGVTTGVPKWVAETVSVQPA